MHFKTLLEGSENLPELELSTNEDQDSEEPKGLNKEFTIEEFIQELKRIK